VHHDDIVKIIKSRGISKNGMRLITELAFAADRHALDLDTSTWQLACTSPEELRHELLIKMRDSDPPVRVSELWAQLAPPGTILDQTSTSLVLRSLTIPGRRS
jgi:hypothetical protein